MLLRGFDKYRYSLLVLPHGAIFPPDLGHGSRLQLENRLLAPTHMSGRVPPHGRSSVLTPPPQVLYNMAKSNNAFG
jgi:hypothetical protein